MPWEVYEIEICEDFKECHVVPDYGPVHLFNMHCWCHPKRDKEEPTVIVHNEGH